MMGFSKMLYDPYTDVPELFFQFVTHITTSNLASHSHIQSDTWHDLCASEDTSAVQQQSAGHTAQLALGNGCLCV